MAQRSKGSKCRNCGDIFNPDHRNVGRQACCIKDECRKANKAESQKRWLNKPENRDYFRGKQNVERVRRWREKNPGYWLEKSPEPSGTSQDPLEEKPVVNQPVASTISSPVKDALQDSLSVQCAVLTGLIIQLSGCALQDDIAM